MFERVLNTPLVIDAYPAPHALKLSRKIINFFVNKFVRFYFLEVPASSIS